MTTTEAKAPANPINLDVFNTQGNKVGSIQLQPGDGGVDINRQLLHDVVVMHLANQRAGTHSTLRRGEVAGSTKKLFKQKHTGNARAGTRRTNKRRGGGTAKGPKPRDYEYHMPKQAVRNALRMALLSRFLDNETIVLDELKLPEIGTGYMADILGALDLDDRSCLIGLGSKDIDEGRTIYLSTRNIPYVEVHPASQFNTYGVLRPKKLVLTKNALEELCQKFAWKQG